MKYDVCYITESRLEPQQLTGQVVSIKPAGSVWSRYEKGEMNNPIHAVDLSVIELELTEEELDWHNSGDWRILLRKEGDNYVIERTVKYLGHV